MAVKDAQWHERRRGGVGGGDIAAIMGLSSWTRPLQVYGRKTGELPLGPSNPRGELLEAAVIRRFERLSGLSVGPGTDFLRHPRWPDLRIQVNTDGQVEGPAPGVFEAKTVGRGTRKAKQLAAGCLPVAFATQLQCYLAATGLSWGVLAALVGPRHFDQWQPSQCELIALRFEKVPRAVAIIEDVASQFWGCVEERRPPQWRRHPLANELERVLRRAPIEPVRAQG